MEIRENFQALLKTAETDLKAGIDKIRYELAQKSLTKTPRGADIYLEQTIELLSSEALKVLNEIKYMVFKAKEWEPIRVSVNKFIDEQFDLFQNFLVNDWRQPASQITSQLILLKSSVLGESNAFIDRQKIKLSKGEHTVKDVLKILSYGIAAGIVGFLLKLILSQ